MTLLARVASVLERTGIRYALIGAGAMAARGVSRSTHDIDLFTTDSRALEPLTWHSLDDLGVDVRRGGAQDPLAGVVRISAPGERDVDVVVGRGGWQHEVVSRAERTHVGDVDLPVASAADLVLLKLYAGGSQDRWDIEQLLAMGDERLVRDVETRLADLPSDARALWQTLRRGSERGSAS